MGAASRHARRAELAGGVLNATTVGATATAVSLGCSTRLPPASTESPNGATLAATLQAPGARKVMSSIHTPTSDTELSEAKRKRKNALWPEKSDRSTRISWKARLSPDQARRPASGLWKLGLMVAL